MEPSESDDRFAAVLAGLKPGSGALIAIVGPSGAGKDTLIHWLRHREDTRHVLFVRRVVTRDADPVHEDHATLSVAAFTAAADAGRFAVTWGAHGLMYGVPATACDHVGSGGLAIVNGSRKALADLRAAFANLVIVHVDAAPDVRAARLRHRGRETGSDIASRLGRVAAANDPSGMTVHIDNSAAIEEAGGAALALLRAIAARLGTDNR